MMPKPQSGKEPEPPEELDFEFDSESYAFFRKLGFDDSRSYLMAIQGVNHNQARNLIDKGCSHEDAFHILF